MRLRRLIELCGGDFEILTCETQNIAPIKIFNTIFSSLIIYQK